MHYGCNPLAFHYSFSVKQFNRSRPRGGALDFIPLLTDEKKEYTPVHPHTPFSHTFMSQFRVSNQANTSVFEVLEHISKSGVQSVYFQAYTLTLGLCTGVTSECVCVCVRQCDGVMKQPSLTPLCLYSGQWRSACLCESAGEKNISKEL